MNKRIALAALLLAGALRAQADEAPGTGLLVIDTDLGLDDAVAVALALQSPHLEVASLVATEGVAGEDRGSRAWRLLDFFNRHDVTLAVAPPAVPRPAAPPFRAFAAAALDRALPPDESSRQHPGPTAQSYAPAAGRTTVLALGPLTGLAAALRAEPQLAARIARVIVAGPSDPEQNWNLTFDRAAYEAVRLSGITLVFVVPDDQARKPAAWSSALPGAGGRSTLADSLFGALFTDAGRRQHWLAGMPRFHDELAVLFLLEPGLFRDGSPGTVTAIDSLRVADHFREALTTARLHRGHVALARAPLPATVLAADVAARYAAIVAKNGEEEWFAQLLTQEVHGHLGAYSILGAKMGIRAAELLNAPLHGMRVVSQTPDAQPIGCLDDGLVLATGSTPGRRLYTHQAGPAGAVQATFEYNGRHLVLQLAPLYRERIAAAIGALAAQHSLDDPAYWSGVRELGLEMWENWHRRHLFQVVE